MFIFVCLVIVMLSLFLINKALKISSENSLSYSSSKRDTFIILGFFHNHHPATRESHGDFEKKLFAIAIYASGLRLETDDAGGIDPHKPVVMNT